MDIYKDKIDISLKKALDQELLVNKEIGEVKARIESYQSMLQVVPLYEDTASLLLELENIVITPPDLSKYEELEESVKDSITNTKQAILYQQELSSVEESLNVIGHTILQVPQTHAIECPNCQHNFHFELSESNSKIARMESSYAKLINRKDQLHQAINCMPVEDLSELNAILTKCSNKKKSLSKDFLEAQQKHTLLSKQLQKLELINSNITHIKESNDKIQNNVDKLSIKLNQFLLKSSSISNEIDLLKQTKAIFSPSGLPAYILDSAVNFFNERVSFYLSKIWVNADFFLNTYKETKAGEVKAKMSESFYNLGQTRSISSLSGGEYRLLCIAVDMAIIDMFSSMTGTVVQFIAWDEPFNGLDASNRARIWPLLTQFAESREVWLIDHSTEFKSMFSNVIEIHKKDGISSVV
jgi:DNA repair exonuclease SbcCD ATPase subunit